MAKSARIVKKKGNRFLLDLANGVSVTARRQSAVKLSNKAAYQTARASLLASQLRALEKTIASKFLDQASTTETSAAQFALQQQLTDSKITASNVTLLQKQVNDIAATLNSIERSWSTLKNDVANKLKLLAGDYTAQVAKLKDALKRVKSRGQADAINTSIVKLGDLYRLSKSNIINLAREDKSRLSAQLADNQSALLAKKMELEKAVQASRQTRVLQQELQRLRPTPIPTFRAPRTKRKVVVKRKPRRR